MDPPFAFSIQFVRPDYNCDTPSKLSKQVGNYEIRKQCSDNIKALLQKKSKKISAPPAMIELSANQQVS